MTSDSGETAPVPDPERYVFPPQVAGALRTVPGEWARDTDNLLDLMIALEGL